MMRRLDRLESQLSSAANIADNTTKQQLPLQSIIQLLENRQFHKLLDIHNIIQTVQCFQCPPTPLCCDAKVLVREVRNKRVWVQVLILLVVILSVSADTSWKSDWTSSQLQCILYSQFKVILEFQTSNQIQISPNVARKLKLGLTCFFSVNSN